MKRRVDPQAARAKTFNIPKDFREELRKLQAMKKKLALEKIEDQSVESSFADANEKRSIVDNRDLVSVTTLGQNGAATH